VIVDFGCLKQRVIIEVDGGQHNADEHARRDSTREARLNRDDFRVLRFWNSDVDGNLVGVLETIDAVLSERPPTRRSCGPPPSPFGGGISASPRLIRRSAASATRLEGSSRPCNLQLLCDATIGFSL